MVINTKKQKVSCLFSNLRHGNGQKTTKNTTSQIRSKKAVEILLRRIPLGYESEFASELKNENTLWDFPVENREKLSVSTLNKLGFVNDVEGCFGFLEAGS